MLMILALHAFNTYFWDSLSNLSNQMTSQDIIVILGESFTSCAGGLFVFIPGWFGIRPKVKSVANIVFQVIFYGFIILIVTSFTTGSVSWKGVKELVLLTDSLWFIKSYFLLYILSPILNSFVENADERKLRAVIVTFFVFQSIWGWTDTAKEFNYGLSVVFFIFMYLLARYMRLFLNKRIDSISKFVFLGIYGLSAILIAASVFVKHYFGLIPLTEQMLLSYVRPLMVLCSVSLFLFFSKAHFKSKAINWISTSCLSGYLIHMNSIVAPVYTNIVGAELLERKYFLLFTIIIGVFFFCAAVDQIRQWVYKFTVGLLFDKRWHLFSIVIL